MIDLKKYNLDEEIKKIKNTECKPNDIDWYSSRKIIHELYDIPKSFNIEAYPFHGINITDYELKDYALLQNCPTLCTRQSQVEYLLEKDGDKNKTFASGALFPMYRRLKDIKQDKDVRGTIVFPAHSCRQIDTNTDWQGFVHDLKKLPEKFKPINICIYYLDILKNRHKPFVDAGFNVYTAGHCNDVDFVDNFYEICRHHKYALTNIASGSNILYTAELGLKTFIYAESSCQGLVETNCFEEIGFKTLEENALKSYIDINFQFFHQNFPTYPNTEMSAENLKNIKAKLGLDYQTPKKIVRDCIIKYAKKMRGNIFQRFLKFLYCKTRIDDSTRNVEILGFIKFSYKRKKTKKEKSEELKNAWIACEQQHFDIFSKSDMVLALNENSVCIDCGANIGVITELFASRGAEVHSFEPYSACFSELQRKFADNSKIHLYNAGVLDKNTTMKLYKFNYQDCDDLFFSQGASLYSSNEEVFKDEYEEVEVIDLSEFVEKLNKKIDILKIDIEGAEYDVLKSLIDKELYKNIKHILVEVHEETIPEIREKAKLIRDLIKEKNITNINLDWV